MAEGECFLTTPSPSAPPSADHVRPSTLTTCGFTICGTKAQADFFEAGFPVEKVAMVTGHKDWRQLRRYTDLKPEDLHKLQKTAQPPMEEFIATRYNRHSKPLRPERRERQPSR